MSNKTFVENLAQREVLNSDFDQAYRTKIPIAITYLMFFVLFCILILLYHITLYEFNWTAIAAFRIPMPVEDEPGKNINVLAVILCVESFGLLLNIYFAQHMTKSILNKWYNKIPMLQEKKLFVPASILFMTLYPIISILWTIAFMNNSTLYSFFRGINGYVILLFLIGLSFYLSYKIIKKLQY